MTQQLIQIKFLDRSPLNVRKTEPKAALEELKASILAHGLMQNLVVVPGKKKGRYEVIAGGRRLSALIELLDEAKLPDDFEVPCRVADPAEATEMSLAENVVRQAMHPADQFEAFAALIDQGQTAEQVANRFGTSVKTVEQRMKLARVAPEILAAYRAADLTLDAVMAFTVTDDQARQVTVFESLNDWQKEDASHIRRRLTEKMAEANNRLVKFVTLDAYLAAGGTTRSDLFGDEVYLEDAALLDELVDRKLKETDATLKTEGWGWVQVDAERDWQATQGCTRIHPVATDVPEELTAELEVAKAEVGKLDEQIEAVDDEDEDALDALWEQHEKAGEKVEEIEDRIADLASFAPEQIAAAGCYAYVDYGGKLIVERGLVKRQDAKKVKQAANDDGDAVEQPRPMPESLKRDLEAYRLGAAQVAIANNPAIAFDLLVFKAVKAVCSISQAYDGPQVSFNEQSGGTASADARGFIAQKMDAIEGNLPLDWQEHDNEADQFASFQALTPEQKHQSLAFCVASTLQPKLLNGEPQSAYDIALAQTGVDVTDHWRPSATNYLGRMTSDQLLDLGSELFDPTFASRWGKAKKGELVAVLDKAFADPSKDERAEVQERLRKWLPAGMAFGALPAEAATVKSKPKKSKRAA